MKIKICGIKHRENMKEVAALAPDFMGFIFYKDSARYMARHLQPEDLADLPPSICKTGVFVNEDYEGVLNTVLEYGLDAVQLHGEKRAQYVSMLKSSMPKGVLLIKAFGIDESFKWSSLNHYQDYCDIFLFDTKTSKYGGSGQRFNLELLKEYKLDVPVMIAGGIGVDELDEVLSGLGDLKVIGVDLNSKLEIEPGLKDPGLVETAISKVRSVND